MLTRGADNAVGTMEDLTGLDIDDWKYTDQGIVYQPLGSPYSVRIIQGLNGLAGSFSGMLKTPPACTMPCSFQRGQTRSSAARRPAVSAPKRWR